MSLMEQQREPVANLFSCRMFNVLKIEWKTYISLVVDIHFLMLFEGEIR